MARIIIKTTGAQNFTLPAAWNPASNTIACITGGGGGLNSPSGSGGRGGNFASITNLNMPAGSVVPCYVGVGAPHGGISLPGDTWFGGTGGVVSAYVGASIYTGTLNGTTVQRGGIGGSEGIPGGGGGGGAAAGAGGDGGAGGSSIATYAGGAGGGGASGGSVGGTSFHNIGGAGGTSPSGGIGGAGSNSSPLTVSGNGSQGVDLSGGGGGGGAAFSGAGHPQAGHGGLYGGAGGGAGYFAYLGGDGAQGAIIITYEPVTPPPPPPVISPGFFLMERFDDRLWQSVEDAYAVDSGVSNPMLTPAANLTATTATGAVTFSADAAVFTAANIGDVIRMANGIAQITAFTSTQIVVGTWFLNAQTAPLPFPYAASGSWTISTPITSFNAPHLAGFTGLVGLADGVPLSGLSATNDQLGTITLPFPASNVKVGLSFLPQLQTPYLNGPQVIQGGRKVIPAATVRVAASAAFQVGTNQPDGAAQNPPQLSPTWSSATPGGTLSTFNPLNPTGGQTAPVNYTSPGGATVTPLWTGDLRGITGGASWESKGQIAVQMPLPMALEVVSIEPEGLPGDQPENTYQQRGEGGGEQQPRPPGRHMISGPRI